MRLNRHEKLLGRFTVLAVVICLIIHFMHPRATSKTPDPAKVERVELFVDPTRISSPRLASLQLAQARPLGVELSPKEVAYAKPSFIRSFGARNKEVRLILAKLNGGGDETENAMEMGLAYLARQQDVSGAWSPKRYPIGSTGLAVNCFLGAGYSHVEGKYKEAVAKGLKYLLSRQASSGRMNSESLYSTAIGGMSFAEAYGLTGDAVYKAAAEKCLAYLVKAQGPKGGWYYSPGPHHELGDHYNYDTSVTGWVLMTFKSAKMAGLHIPHAVVERYFDYARAVTYARDEEVPAAGRNKRRRKPRWYRGMACYGIRGHVDRRTKKGTYALQNRHFYTMTASTLMCRLYMGDNRHSPLVKEGLAHLTTRLPESQKPRWTDRERRLDNYLWYHAAQVAFLVGGKAWTTWNDALKKLLVEHQIKEGDERGGWNNALFKWSDRSLVYPTCLNIMILQTYYRYYR